MRTDEELFTDIPVTAQWRSGHYHWQESGSALNSELVFDVPEEITRRVQSLKAQNVARRWFGQSKTVELEKAFLPTREEIVSYRPPEWTKDVREELIVDDWDMLREAIHLTARDSGGYLGGQTVKVWGPRRGHAVAARISEDRLELHLGETVVDDMHAAWSRAFRREVLLEGIK